jgi:hypothetical protein
MGLRAASILAAILALAAVAPAGAQTQTNDLGELWEQFPLEAPPDDERPVGERERSGSLAGPPPRPEEPAGPLAESLLFLALALGVVGVAGALHQLVRALRRRRRGEPGGLGAGAGDLGG